MGGLGLNFRWEDNIKIDLRKVDSEEEGCMQMVLDAVHL
jgi:hypothetical protein